VLSQDGWIRKRHLIWVICSPSGTRWLCAKKMYPLPGGRRCPQRVNQWLFSSLPDFFGRALLHNTQTTQLYVVVDLLSHEFPWRLKWNVVVVEPSPEDLLPHCILSSLYSENVFFYLLFKGNISTISISSPLNSIKQRIFCLFIFTFFCISDSFPVYNYSG